MRILSSHNHLVFIFILAAVIFIVIVIITIFLLNNNRVLSSTQTIIMHETLWTEYLVSSIKKTLPSNEIIFVPELQNIPLNGKYPNINKDALILTYKLLEMTHVSFPVALGMTLFLFETRYGLE